VNAVPSSIARSPTSPTTEQLRVRTEAVQVYTSP
jgi:hypothetical protein